MAAINLEAVSGRGFCSRWVGGAATGLLISMPVYTDLLSGRGCRRPAKTGVGGATAVFRAVQRRLEDRETVGVAVVLKAVVGRGWCSHR